MNAMKIYYLILISFLISGFSTKESARKEYTDDITSDLVNYLKDKKLIEPQAKDTIFIACRFTPVLSKKYYFIKGKLHLMEKACKCDHYVRVNNCVNFLNFQFENNRFKRAEFELTNSSTTNGFITKEEWGYSHQVLGKYTD